MRKSLVWKNLLLICALVLSGAGLPSSKVLAESPREWYRQGQLAVQKAQKLKINNRVAKNVILFIGDGMNLPTVTAARILAGQSLGKKGEEHILSFEKLPHVALSKTYCTNAQVTDSAAAMTAIITGVKTKDGLLSVNQKVTPQKASTVPGNKLLTLLERAEKRGLATGVVSTTRITHATPGACYAHSPDRGWEGDANITSEDPANAAFPDIARQLLEFPYGNGLEVALGGGRAYFQPETTPDPEYPSKVGKRKDGRDLTQEWVTRYKGGAYVWNKAQFDAIDPAKTRHLLGLFERSHMHYEKDRDRDAAGEPSLSNMTAKAIDILAKNRKGYVLVVEGGRIDHAHHASNAYHALHDTLEFARAVQVALDKTNPKNTLIVVTADHGNVLCLTGYPTRGNPILGLVAENDKWGKPTDPPTFTRATDGLPFTTLLYGNGPGYVSPRPDLTGVDTTAPTYRQQSAVPLASDAHSGEDVPIYAGGPGAHLFHGVQEENYIFHAIMAAMKLSSR